MAGLHYLFVVCVVLSVIFVPGNCEVLLKSYFVNGAACLGDTVNFACTTIGSNSLAWSSPEFIGQNGQQLNLSPFGTISRVNGHAVAVVANTYVENDRRVLESNLTIIVQENFPSASVKCSSVGTGESSAILLSFANICGSSGPTESETTQTEKIASQYDQDSVNLDQNAYITDSAATIAFSATVALTAAALGMIID